MNPFDYFPPYNPFHIADPVYRGSDRIIVIILSILGSLLLIPSLILLPFSCKYLAVKRKQPLLMFIAAIFGLIWFFGSAASNGFMHVMFSFKSPKWTCLVFNIWAYYYGVCGWSLCLITRLITLFLINQLQIKRNKVYPTFIFAGLMIPPTLLFIGMSFVPDVFVMQEENFDCRVRWPTSLVILLLVLLFLAILFTLTIFTCKTRREFNESWVEIVGIILCFFLAIFLLFCWTIRLNWLLPIRILNLFQSLLAGYYYAFAVQGYVLFKVLTCQFKWFSKWENDFKENTKNLLEVRKFKEQIKKERKRSLSNGSRRRFPLTSFNSIDLPLVDSSSESDYEYDDYKMQPSA